MPQTFAGGAVAPNRLVTTPIRGAGYLVEVRDYTFPTPRDALYEPVDHHVEFTLSPQPVRGSYPGAFRDLRPLGQVILIPAAHRLRAVNDAGIKRSLICDVSPSKLPVFADLDWGPANLARAMDIRSPSLDALFSVLLHEVFSPGVASDILVDAIIVAMMVELRRYFGEEEEASRAGRLAPWQIRLIREQVGRGAALDGTIAHLAAACGLSARQLTRAFVATTGRSIGEYIKTSRIDQAKRLLSEPNLMIKEVAYKCGFKTAAAFAAVFKKATGTTPIEYRRWVRPST